MTDEEIRIMYRWAKNKHKQIQILSELTGKSKREIRQILGLDEKEPARKRSVPVGRAWTQEDEDLLIEMFRQGKSRAEIRSALNRSENSVNSKITKLNLNHKEVSQ